MTSFLLLFTLVPLAAVQAGPSGSKERHRDVKSKDKDRRSSIEEKTNKRAEERIDKRIEERMDKRVEERIDERFGKESRDREDREQKERIPPVEKDRYAIDNISQSERNELANRSMPDIKGKKFTLVREARDLGGLTPKYIMKDQRGDKWLFKTTGGMSEAEVGANKLLKDLGYFAVDIERVTLNIPNKGELSGSIQKMIKLKTWEVGKIDKKKYTVDLSKLTNKNLIQLQQHQIIDYLIGNTDCHKNNFGIDHKGDIVAFDKGEALSAFNFVHQNKKFDLSEFNIKLYEDLWGGWLENKYKMDFMAAEPLIEKIENLPDAVFLDRFRSYAEEYEKQTGESAKEFLDKLVKHKREIRSDVKAFYKELARKKGISFEGFSSDAPEVHVDKLSSSIR